MSHPFHDRLFVVADGWLDALWAKIRRPWCKVIQADAVVDGRWDGLTCGMLAVTERCRARRMSEIHSWYIAVGDQIIRRNMLDLTEAIEFVLGKIDQQ